MLVQAVPLEPDLIADLRTGDGPSQAGLGQGASPDLPAWLRGAVRAGFASMLRWSHSGQGLACR
jgi:hypothetical protein